MRAKSHYLAGIAYRDVSGVAAPYSQSVIAAFEVAFARRLTGNAALAAFGLRELRASGFTGEARLKRDDA